MSLEALDHDLDHDGDGRIVPPPSNPMGVARVFLAERHQDAGEETLLRCHRGSWYRWDGRCWPEIEERDLRAELYDWLDSAVYAKTIKDEEVLVPFEPTRHKVANVVEAIAAIGNIGGRVEAPAWLTAAPWPAVECVSLSNGILHVPTRELVPHTPGLFTQHALPFAYDPESSVPTRWLRFLEELWGDDQEAIDTLGEIFGYALAGGTAQQKIFLLVGPKRSGKGTIARVLTGLLGVHHVAAPTLSGLTHNFGLQPLVGRPLATISDARLGTRADSMVAVERLLSISGEDTLTIDRKYRDPWTGRLPTRFLILTNELPRLVDSSGALAGRFVVLTLSTSFYGHEDTTLTDQLLAESAGIFNWSLAGLDRLEQRGHFVQPASSREAIGQLETLGSPVGAFVRERCEVGVGFEIEKDALWQEWRDWCEHEGAKVGTKSVFIRDLRAAFPAVKMSRVREGDSRRQVLVGVKLSQQSGGPLTTPDHPAATRAEETSGQGSSNGPEPHNHAVGQGWSGVESTVEATSTATDVRECARHSADHPRPWCQGCLAAGWVEVAS